MTSKAKNGAYEILAAQKSTVTKIAGVITPEAVDNLENEIGGIFTILKSNHFNEGQRYGCLACVIPEDKYRVVIANNTWVYDAPDNPGAYAVTALGAGVSLLNVNRSLQTTRKRNTAMPSTSARRKPGRSSSSTVQATTHLHPSKNSISTSAMPPSTQ